MKQNDDEKIVFGRHPVIDALDSDAAVDKILVKKELPAGLFRKLKKAAAVKKIPFTTVDEKTLNRICSGGNHQGVAAKMAFREYDTPDDVFDAAYAKKEDPFILVLNEVQDPHNLGSLIRTAAGLGVHGVIIPRHRSAKLSSTVSKVAAGADFYIRIAQVTNIADTLEELKERGLTVIGAEAEAEKGVGEVDFSGPVALVMGGEDKGLGSRVKSICDFLVKISLKNAISSLNVGVAGGILMFKAQERR